MLEWINVFKVNRKIKSRLWPWIKIILSIVLFFAVFYGDIYVHILDGTNLGRIVEAMILVVFSFLDYLICFISVAEMDCLKDRRYAAAKESGEFYTISNRKLPVQLRAAYLYDLLPAGKQKTYLRRTDKNDRKSAGNGQQRIFHRTDRKARADCERPRYADERSKKYARFDKVLVQAINGEPVKK